jgi:thymidylate kinase
VIVAGPRAGDRAAISIVRELCVELAAAGVEYCHWKSNAFLDRSLSGENDLDLLVRRRDWTSFGATLGRLGFKLVASPRALPGVTSYYGYDADADRLVHVHAHYQLVVGDDLTKNYRLPLEDALLDSTTSDGELPVPAPELELLVLVVRLALKHLTWDAIISNNTRVSRAARTELDHLLARAPTERVTQALEQHLPTMGRGLFDDCVRALEPGRGRREQVRVGARVLAATEPYSRRSRSADVALKVWRRGAGSARRAASRPPRRKRFARGGALVAFVGADGAGKSTLVSALHEWLGRSFEVQRVHLGRPRPSWPTRAVRLSVRGRNALGLVLSGRLTRGPDWQPGGQAALAVAVARDRYRTYRVARRAATNGVVVLCDRFPLPQLRLMDSPRVRTGRLGALEARYYRRIGQPELLVVLRVDPEVAVERKSEEAPEFVRARWTEIWDVDWGAAGAHVLDAGRPQSEVIAAAKALVWAEL